ncbi:MAG TPA: ABC transporter substrate-binding protein [Devosiaceae bacterium]|jgi:peptide/nickel transport system substrate-binding protein
MHLKLAGALLATIFTVQATYAQDARTLTIAVPQEPPTFDICAMGSNAASRVIFGNIGEGLTQRDPASGDLKPLLATSWEQSSPTTWVFHLRQGVKFHDGTPFNAQAAVISIQRTFKKELACSVATQAFGAIGVTPKALDDYTLELTTSQEDPILPLRTSFLGMTASSTPTDHQTEEPIGTGPYKEAKWDHGSQIVLEAFPDYWGTKGEATTVTYVFRPEDLVRSQMVGNGEADIAVGLPVEFASAENAVKFQVPETTGLRIHMQSPPFNDIRVRQAVQYALDRDGLIGAVWNGAATPASEPITPDIVGYSPDIPVPAYDPDKAKQLIAAAKADGVPVDTPSLIYTRADIVDNADLLSQAIAEQLNDVGLNVGVQMMEAAPWIDLLRTHPTDKPGFLLEPHNNSLGDASWTANSKYDSSQARSQNRGPLADKADAMIKAANAAQGDERQKLYQDFFKFLNDEVVTDAFIAYTQAVYVIGPRVSYTPNAMSNDVLRVSEIHFK